MIRRAVRSDYLAVAALDREVWLPYPNGKNLPDGEHTWRHWIEDGIVYVLEHEGVLCGAALAFQRLDGGFWLHKIFVAESLRRQGMGRQLMQNILNEIDAHRADVYLTVNPANVRAVKLYRDMGFAAEEITAAYYRAEEPRYEMRRPRR